MSKRNKTKPRRSAPAVQASVSDEPAGIKDFAAAEFEPIAEFADFHGVGATVTEKLKSLGVSARLAVAFLGKTKVELIALVKATDLADKAGDGKAVLEILDLFSDGLKFARNLTELLDAAETRYGAALATVALASARKA